MNNSDIIIAPDCLEKIYPLEWEYVPFFLPIPYIFTANRVPKGFLLVKENVFTQNIDDRHIGIKKSRTFDSKINDALPDSAPVEININSVVNRGGTLHFLYTNELLTKLMQIKNISKESRDLINNVYNERKYGKLVPDVNLPEINVVIPNRLTIVKRKLEAKTGVKFGSFLTRYMIVPSTEININTIDRETYTTEVSVEDGAQNTNQNNGEQVERTIPAIYDIDYKIKVCDIQKLIPKFNVFYDAHGPNAFKYLLNELAKDMESDINKFIQSHSFDDIKRILLVPDDRFKYEIYNVFRSTMESIKEEYGIEIVTFKFNKIVRSEQYRAAEEKARMAKVEAEQKVISAEADKKAKILSAEAESEAKKLLAEANQRAIELEGAAKMQYIINTAEALKQKGLDSRSISLLMSEQKGFSISGLNFLLDGLFNNQNSQNNQNGPVDGNEPRTR